MKTKPPTEAVKTLTVDKSAFDAAMQKLIAAKPVHIKRTGSAPKKSSR